METQQQDEKFGIPHCVFCIGFHPDDRPTSQDLMERVMNPQKVVIKKYSQLKSRMHLYKNKSCELCGTSFFADGGIDESFKITAGRVYQEFVRAGIFGLSDKTTELVVAFGRMKFQFLLANKNYIDRKYWPIFTFSGVIAKWITYGQEYGRGEMEQQVKKEFTKLKLDITKIEESKKQRD